MKINDTYRMLAASLVAVIFLNSDLALAGAKEGGGGAAVVCRDANGKIKSAQLADLYEGERRWKLTIPKIPSSQLSMEEQRNRVKERLKSDELTYFAFKQSLSDILSIHEMLKEDEAFNLIEDLGTDYPIIIPAGCALESAAYYESSGKLKIVPSVFKAMSTTDQAALFIHETVYYMARRFHSAKDSALSRKLTAYLFAEPADAQEIKVLSEKIIRPPANNRIFSGQDGNSAFAIAISNPSKSLVEYWLKCFDYNHPLPYNWDTAKWTDHSGTQTFFRSEEAAIVHVAIDKGCRVLAYGMNVIYASSGGVEPDFVLTYRDQTLTDQKWGQFYPFWKGQ